MAIYLGDFVKVKLPNGTVYRGRVKSKTVMGPPDTIEWNILTIFKSEKDRKKAQIAPWCSILVDGNGSAAYPEYMLQKVKPFKLKNMYSEFLFGG
ncbi:MAG: hypothetical protein ACP6IQ_01920 [Candidatus Njordarchaeia archaeon]